MGKTKILESQIRATIKAFLHYQNWFFFHNLNAGIGVYKGISDLTALKNGVTLWIEIKSPTGKQSKHQIDFEKKIKKNGGHYLVCRSVEDLNKYICENLWDTGVLF